MRIRRPAAPIAPTATPAPTATEDDDPALRAAHAELDRAWKAEVEAERAEARQRAANEQANAEARRRVALGYPFVGPSTPSGTDWQRILGGKTPIDVARSSLREVEALVATARTRASQHRGLGPTGAQALLAEARDAASGFKGIMHEMDIGTELPSRMNAALAELERVAENANWHG